MTSELIAIILTGAVSLTVSIILFMLNRNANKKDAAIINQTIESIKSDFQKINDKNKAEIELLFHTKKEQLSDQKKVIIDFWDEHFHLMRLCATTRYEIDEFRIQDFILLRRKIENLQETCEILYTKIHFHFEDLDFIELCNKINVICTKNSIKFISYTDSIEPLLVSAQNALKIEDYSEYKKANTAIDNKSKIMDQILDNNDPSLLLIEFKKRGRELIFGDSITT